MNRKKYGEILLAALMLGLFLPAGNGFAAEEETAAGRADVTGILSSLFARDDELGLTGKYNSIADIPDGTVDEALEGRWTLADGSTTYSFTAEGIWQAESAEGPGAETAFTCIEAEGRRLLCEDMAVTRYRDDGEPEESVEVQYTAYRVEGDALYMVSIESAAEQYSSYAANLLMFYREDEQGDNRAAVRDNPIAISSLYGDWTSYPGDIRIDEQGLTTPEGTFPCFFNEKNQLVIDREGKEPAYPFALSMQKLYTDETKSELEEQCVGMSLSYTGADEQDTPNIPEVLENWKQDYDWETWYYEGSFQRKE